MATRSSILTWKTSRTEKPGGLQSKGRHNYSKLAHTHPPRVSQELQWESSSLPAETALRAQLSVLLSRIMNVTWVKVLASFSTEQSSINCSGSSGPRFQGTHSADDLLISALGNGTKKQSGLGVSHSPLV